MEKLGKIFGILVLVLSLAVAVLSFLLFAQRKTFRAHSEALADGLNKVAQTIRSAKGTDVNSQLAKVSYTKGANGNKESGTLGFEDYKKDPNSVNNAVTALLEGINLRQKQHEEYATALKDIAVALSGKADLGVHEDEDILSAEDSSEKVAAVTARAQNVAARDEKVRKHLESIAKKAGLNAGNVQPRTFDLCTKTNGKYAGEIYMEELVKSVTIADKRNAMMLDTFAQVRGRITEFNNWQFNANQLKAADAKFYSPESKEDGGAAFLNGDKKWLDALSADASKINRKLQDDAASIAKLNREKSDLEYQVETKNAEIERQTASIADLNKKLGALKEDYDHALGQLKGLEQATLMIENSRLEKPTRPVLEVGGQIARGFSCVVRSVDSNERYVILSATNRDVYPGARLLLAVEDGKEIIELRVKNCTDTGSIAYVTDGNAAHISIGDKVYSYTTANAAK